MNDAIAALEDPSPEMVDDLATLLLNSAHDESSPLAQAHDICQHLGDYLRNEKGGGSTSLREEVAALEEKLAHFMVEYQDEASLSDLRFANEELKKQLAERWQPIETAPKNKQIDLWVPNSDGGERLTDCHWNDKRKLWFDPNAGYEGEGDYIRPWKALDCPRWASEPTHWMPIPKGPGVSNDP